ncbi:DUF5304 domain-containing protein [Streptomyces sp. NPDC058734]|uniref:DUF5304 domain-containing protein n=1 Tax=Streptomyces sp. NPDC058734 TaxID=3346615 RepID=UPI00367D8393
MSEATDHPDADDAWARACAEDLAAEKERRRSSRSGSAGTGTGTAAEELFKLFEAVADKVSSLNNPAVGAVGTAAQDAVRQFVNQAKTAAKPVIERNPEVFGHLAAAGSELLAAYRSAVENHERRWTHDEPPAPRGPADNGGKGDDGPGTGPAQRIDLD